MLRGSTAFVLMLLTVSFAARASLVLALRDVHVGPHGSCSADDVEFNNLALRVSRGGGYVNDQGLATSFRAPGWPLFLAAIYWLCGPHVPVVYLVLCLLGAAACVLTYLLARELVSEWTARAGGILAAFYLPHAYFSAGFLSEGLFVLLLTLGAWLFLLALRRGSLPLLLLAGVVLSYATLTRPFAVLLGPILVVVLITTHIRQVRPWFLWGLAFGIAFSSCIIPWTIRNQRVHGRFVLIATNGGSTFYGGNNERVARETRLLGNWISTTELPHRDWIDATPTEVEHDKMEWRLGLDWLRNNVSSIPFLSMCKMARLCVWLPDFDVGSRLFYMVRAMGYGPFLLLMMLGLLGRVRRRRSWKAEWMVVDGALLATLLTGLVFWGSPRFRDANLPFLMLYAALGLTQLCSHQNVKERKRPLRTPQRDGYEADSNRQAVAPQRVAQNLDTHQ
jgi:4-amino-4-deoxy-L-arabinose transferase-like glycosyltransferase